MRETLEGADNSPAAVAALTERLARQTGMEVIIPALEGYEFIRGQRLSFNGEPLLQLVYLGAEGAPLALCYMPTQQADTDTAVVQRHHGLNTVEWKSTEYIGYFALIWSYGKHLFESCFSKPCNSTMC